MDASGPTRPQEAAGSLESRCTKGSPGWEPRHHGAVTRLQGQPLPLRTLPLAWTKAGDVRGTGGGGPATIGGLALPPATHPPPGPHLTLGTVQGWWELGSRLVSRQQWLREWGAGPAKLPSLTLSRAHPPVGQSLGGWTPAELTPSPGGSLFMELLSSTCWPLWVCTVGAQVEGGVSTSPQAPGPSVETGRQLGEDKGPSLTPGPCGLRRPQPDSRPLWTPEQGLHQAPGRTSPPIRSLPCAGRPPLHLPPPPA